MTASNDKICPLCGMGKMMIKENSIYECNNCGEMFGLDENFNLKLLTLDEWIRRDKNNMRITYDSAGRNFDYKSRLQKYDDVEIVRSERLYDNDNNFWKSIIPSKDVREYHKKIGYEYTGFALAAMITWSDMPFFRKVDELTKIGNKCFDQALKRQINEYVNYMLLSYKSFIYNKDNKYVYILYIRQDEDDDYFKNGYFLKYVDAVFFSKRLECTKKRIVKIETIVNRDEYEDIEDEYIKSEVGWMNFDEKGNICNCYCMDISEPDFGKEGFNIAYIDMPYPFRQGDIVKDVRDHRLGIIHGYKTDEEIKKEYERLKNIIDCSDYQVTVENYFYNWKSDSFYWGHSHISPLYLEYANIDRNSIESDSKEAVMLAASDLVKGESVLWALQYTEEMYQKRVRSTGKI